MIDPYLLGLNVAKVVGHEAYCLCPFHNDSKPSSSFNMDNGVFHCFACGENASAMKIAKTLGGYIVNISDEKYLKTLGWSTENDWRWTQSCSLAIDNEYLAKRGVTNFEVMLYSIRAFSNGIIFPFLDTRGIVTGAQIRTFSGPRYVILGEKPVVWPLQLLKNVGKSQMIFVEGIFGAMNARRGGAQAFATIGANSAAHSIAPFQSMRDKAIVFDDDDSGHANVAKVLMMGYKLAAYSPGIAADEIDEEFWPDLPEHIKRQGYITNHLTFLDSAGASWESREIVRKYADRLKRSKSYGDANYKR